MTTFNRTICNCEVCKAPCRTIPGSLIPGDLDRIMGFCQVEPLHRETWVQTHFRASDGARLLNILTGAISWCPTIVPAQKETGECVFYDEHGLCKIHAVAPAGCAYPDMHMDFEEGERISMWMIRQQSESPYYRVVWDWLVKNGCVATPISNRRKACDELVAKVKAGFGVPPHESNSCT